MDFYEKWIDADYNPFILFSSEGRVLSLNDSAQFLLGSVSEKVLFEHATTYAATSFGFKTTHIPLEFGRFKFFALCVGYENEKEIGLRLYRIPGEEKSLLTQNNAGFDPVNIYTLIDLCISSNSINNQASYSKLVDPTIPEIRIDTDAFIKLINILLTASPASSDIILRLSLKIGEHIKVENKKYSIFKIEVEYDKDYEIQNKSKVESYSKRLGTFLEENEKKLSIDLALIT
ncbi:MAG: hypothetical protein OEW60_06610 [Thiovulaceae bacterium]|nr:hypothetical protein [Sulfurimonadaceae bacterium]